MPYLTFIHEKPGTTVVKDTSWTGDINVAGLQLEHQLIATLFPTLFTIPRT